MKMMTAVDDGAAVEDAEDVGLVESEMGTVAAFQHKNFVKTSHFVSF